MAKFLISFMLFLSVGFSSSVELPSSFKKCSRKQDDLNDCLAKSLQDALSQLTKPFPEVGLPSLDPLETQNLTVQAGNDVMKFPQVYTYFNIYGFTNGNVTKFNFNFENKTVYIEVTVPELKIQFEYDYNGKLLLVPIKGSGPGKAYAYNMSYCITFTLEEYEKDGKKYFKVVDTDVKEEVERFKFDYENMSRLDGLLGLGNLLKPNDLFNNNWRKIFLDIKGVYEDFQADTFGKIFNSLLEKVSISELFLD